MSRTVFALLAVSSACSITCYAQAPQFEAASIKPSSPELRSKIGERGGPGTSSPGQWVCTGMSLRALIVKGWEVGGSQLAGPPSLSEVRYDIVAKLPPRTSYADFRLMIRNLLIARLALKVHRKSVIQTVDQMVIGRKGLKLRPAEVPPGAPSDEPPGPIRPDKDGNPYLPPGRPSMVHMSIGDTIILGGRMQTIADIARALEGPRKRAIIDMTGLSGQYDYNLRFAMDGPATGDVSNLLEASLPEALEQQLGLRLVSTEMPVDVVHVDSFNRIPIED